MRACVRVCVCVVPVAWPDTTLPPGVCVEGGRGVDVAEVGGVGEERERRTAREWRRAGQLFRENIHRGEMRWRGGGGGGGGGELGKDIKTRTPVLKPVR